MQNDKNGFNFCMYSFNNISILKDILLISIIKGQLVSRKQFQTYNKQMIFLNLQVLLKAMDTVYPKLKTISVYLWICPYISSGNVYH